MRRVILASLMLLLAVPAAAAVRSPLLDGANAHVTYTDPPEVALYLGAGVPVPADAYPRLAVTVACEQIGLAAALGHGLALPARVSLYRWDPTAGGGWAPRLVFATTVRTCGEAL